MDNQPLDTPADPRPPGPARFYAGRFLFWMPACLAYGGSIGWAAVLVERSHAPLGLFPLLVGALLGASLIGLSRVCQVGNRFTIVLGVVLAALAAVASQHYVSYRDARRQADEDARSYRLARLAFGDAVLGQSPIPPAGLLDFLQWRAARGVDVLGYRAKGAAVWLIWAADALLLLAAAVAVAFPGLRRPYCDRCRSWFATTRRGPLDPVTAHNAAALIETDLPDEVRSARYRLFACRGGCGPVGFELRWEGPGGAASKKVWLDHQRRNHVVRALDEGLSHQA